MRFVRRLVLSHLHPLSSSNLCYGPHRTSVTLYWLHHLQKLILRENYATHTFFGLSASILSSFCLEFEAGMGPSFIFIAMTKYSDKLRILKEERVYFSS